MLNFDLRTELPGAKPKRHYSERNPLPTYPMVPPTAGLETKLLEEEEYITIPNSKTSNTLGIRENPRFYGRSSCMFFIHTIADGNNLIGELTEVGKVPIIEVINKRRPEFWEPSSVGFNSIFLIVCSDGSLRLSG